MEFLKKILPSPVKAVILAVMGTLFYRNYDSSAYWKKRAGSPGQAAVLWTNQGYNDLYRADQRRILEPWIMGLPSGAAVLDIGCGIGVVATMIRSMRADIRIHAVDFEEMIQVALSRSQGDGIDYISSSAEDYVSVDTKYDIIVSSGCYSAIRDISKLKKSLDNGVAMLKSGGVMLMIDPFHRWNYLARAKFNTNDVVAHLKPQGLTLELKSGVLFWPYRVKLADSQLEGAELEAAYRKGEAMLEHYGRHFWADYKVLAFRKGA